MSVVEPFSGGSEDICVDAFHWLTATAITVRKVPGATVLPDPDVSSVWDQISELVKQVVAKPQGQSKALRTAFDDALRAVSARSSSNKFELQLNTQLIEIIDSEDRKKPWQARHFVASALGSIASLPKDGLYATARNSFESLADALKGAPSATSSNASAGYRRTLLHSLARSASTAEVASLDPQILKYIWKQARSYTSDPSHIVAAAAWDLMAVLVTPALVRTTSKFEKLGTLFTKAGSHPNFAVRAAAASFYATLITRLETRELEAEPDRAERDEELQRTTTTDSNLSSVTKVRITARAIITSKCSQYVNASTTPRLATTLVLFFEHLLRTRTADELVNDFGFLASQFITLGTGPKLSEYRRTLGFKHAQYLLFDIIAKQYVLTDKLRLALTRSLIQQLATTDKIHQQGVHALLATLGDLVTILGSSVGSLADLINQACVGMLENSTSWSLSVAVIDCLGKVVDQAPSLILGLMTYSLQKITASPSIEYAYLIATLIARCDKFPTYVSLELNSQVLSTASGLIKQAQKGHPENDNMKYEVGWILLEGVLCLGPRVMKLYVSQLLQLWKTSLTKIPAPRADANPVEVKYQLKTRHRALTGLLVFMVHNASLVTPDVTRRLGLMLHNVWTFVDEIPLKLLATVEVQNDSWIARQKLLQCYESLALYDQSDIYPASLLTCSVAYLTSPEVPSAPNAGPTVISHGGIDNVHELADNFGAGIISGVFKSENKLLELEHSPVGTQLSNDPDQLLLGGHQVPIYTSIVDAAVNVITRVLPIQHARVQESLLDRIRSDVEKQKTVPQLDKKKNINLRPQATGLNTAFLMNKLLLHARSHPKVQQAYSDDRIVRILGDIVKLLVQSPDHTVRRLGSESIGLLVSVVDDQAIVAEYVKFAVDTIISNLDPFPRSGYALALGKILELAQNKFTASHVKAIVGVVLPLANDPHPVVHRWALEALDLTISNAGILAPSIIPSALSALVKIYTLPTHNDETDSAIYSNMEVDFLESSTVLTISRGISTLISSLGPGLQADPKALETLNQLIFQFQSPLQSSAVVAESWSSLQELFYFAKDDIDWFTVIRRWAYTIEQPVTEVALDTWQAAIDGIAVLFKSAASRIIEVAGPRFEVVLWLALDRDPNNSALRQILTTWVEQTASSEPTKWISRLQRIIMRPRYLFEAAITDVRVVEDAAVKAAAAVAAANSKGELADEDESLGPQSEQTSTELLSWRTRQFATELLLLLLRSELKQKVLQVRQQSIITRNVGDVIKIAFSAATSTVLSMQLAGLELLDEIVNDLSDVVDPDFPEVSLLEQYQAQISSALTPAFQIDSSPELAMAALHVSGTFISSGVVKHPEKFGRILKILTDALESSDYTSFTLGDMKLSPNAKNILRVGVLRLWASIQSASRERDYLQDVVSPHQEVLVSLWMATLKDYAKLKFEPEQSTTTSFAASLDHMHSTELRQILLPTYQDSWLELVSALAALIEFNGAEILETENTSSESFLFVLFGLCFEALLRPAKPGQPQLPVLVALQRILLPSVSASVVYDEGIFAETLEILDRIVLTGTPSEQASIVKIARNLASAETESDESVDHLFEIFRVSTLPLRNLFPSLAEVANPVSKSINSSENLDLIKLTLDSLIDMVPTFREVIQNDLYICVMYIFDKITEIPEAQAEVVPHIFSSYKHLMEVMAQSYKKGSEETKQMLNNAVATAFVDSFAQLEQATDTVSRTNRMLICMVIVVANGELLKNALGNITQFGRLLGKFLADSDLTKVTSEAIKAVFTAGTRQPEILAAFVHGAIPVMIEELVNSRDDSVLPKQVCNLLVKYATQQKTASVALSIVIPVLLFTFNKEDWLTTEQRTLYVQALLLSLVQKHPQDFRTSVLAVPQQDRDTLQKLLVHEQQAQPEEADASITLTSFG